MQCSAARATCATPFDCDVFGCQHAAEAARPPAPAAGLGLLERSVVRVHHALERLAGKQPEPAPAELPPLRSLPLGACIEVAPPPPLPAALLFQENPPMPDLMPLPTAPALPPASGDAVTIQRIGSGWMILTGATPVDVATSPEGVGERVAALLRR